MNDPFPIPMTKAEFRRGDDGTVKEMGALLEPMMGEEKIWFRKIGGKFRPFHQRLYLQLTHGDAWVLSG